MNGMLIAVSNHALRGLFQHFLLNVSRVKFPELVVAYRQEQCRAGGKHHNECSQDFDFHDPPQTTYPNITSGAGPAGTQSRIYFVDFFPRKNRTRSRVPGETTVPLNFSQNTVLQCIIGKESGSGLLRQYWQGRRVHRGRIIAQLDV